MTITEEKFNGGSVEFDISEDVFLNFDLGRLKVITPTLKAQRVYLQNAQLHPWIVGGVVYDIINLGSYSVFVFDWQGNYTGIEIGPNQRGGISLGNTDEEQGDAWRCNCRDLLSVTTTTSTTSTTSTTTTPTTTSTTSITTSGPTTNTVGDQFTGTWGDPNDVAGSSSEDPRVDPNYTNLPIFSAPAAAFGTLGPRVPRMRAPAALSVAVVVTTINEGSDFEATLESLLTASRVPEMIVVVDDGSVESFEVRSRAFDGRGSNIVFVRNEYRKGCAASRDAGFRAVDADLYIFVDSHMNFPSNWLDEMVAAHTLHPNAILAPISSDIDDDGSAPKQGGHWGTGADLYVHPEKGITAKWAPISALPVSTLRTPAMMGACYLAPKQLLRDIGGWSMGLRGWGFDEEFVCTRAWLMGYEVRLVSSVHVSHRYMRDTALLARIDATGESEPGWVLRYTRQYVNYVLFGRVDQSLFMGECEETETAREEMRINFDRWRADRAYVQNRRVLSDKQLWDVLNEVRIESSIAAIAGGRHAVNQ